MYFVKRLQGSIQDDTINIKTDYSEIKMERPSVWVYGVLTFYLFAVQLKNILMKNGGVCLSSIIFLILSNTLTEGYVKHSCL